MYEQQLVSFPLSRTQMHVDKRPRCTLCIPIQIQEDSDSALYTVVLFKRVCDAFKHAAQEQGFQASVSCCSNGHL